MEILAVESKLNFTVKGLFEVDKDKEWLRA